MKQFLLLTCGRWRMEAPADGAEIGAEWQLGGGGGGRREIGLKGPWAGFQEPAYGPVKLSSTMGRFVQ